MTLNVCVAQLNLTVGDLAGNASKIIAASRQAYAQGARLVVTPELSICGYPPEDLLLRPAFMAGCEDAVQRVAAELAESGLADFDVLNFFALAAPAGTPAAIIDKLNKPKAPAP